MTKSENKPRADIDGIEVYCAFDKIVEVSELTENPNNPNTHPKDQIKMLAEIIKKNRMACADYSF